MEHNKPNIVVIAASCEQRGFRYSMANCMFEAAFEVSFVLFQLLQRKSCLLLQSILAQCTCYPVFHSEYFQGKSQWKVLF